MVACDGDDDEDDVPPAPEPTAAFTFSPNEPKVGETVSFNNSSQDASTYAWDFGDGGTSTDENPTYVYNTAGTYTITLTASGEGGEASTSLDVTVTEEAPPSADPVADFVYSPAPAKIGEPVQFQNLSENVVSYAWEFGDGGTSTEENPVYTYNEAGTYTVKLTATSEDGVSVEQERPITVESPQFNVKVLSMTIRGIDALGSDDFPQWDEPAVGIFDLPISEITSLGQAVWVAQFGDEGLTADDLPLTLPMDLPNNDLPAYEIEDLEQSFYFFLGGRGDEEGTVSVLMYHEVILSEFAGDRPTEIELREEEGGVDYTLTVEWVEQ